MTVVVRQWPPPWPTPPWFGFDILTNPGAPVTATPTAEGGGTPVTPTATPTPAGISK
jgi:hypothetical protein